MIVASVVIIGALMSILDATVVNVALRTLSVELHASLSTIQWVISGYTLALASTIPLSGWAADRFGASRMWIMAVAAFTVGSVLCGIAWSPGSLIAFRVLQGAAGGLLTPIGTTIIARQAGPQRMGHVMALLGVPLLLGPVLGPVVGGVLSQSASWRWIFIINAPIGALAIVLGLRLLPKQTPQRAVRLDVVSVLLLSPGLAGLIYSLSETRSVGAIGTAKVLLPLVASVALIVGFIVRTLRAQAPLVDLRLFRRRTFAASSLTTFAMGVAAFGAMLLLPLYYQEVRGQDVLVTGLLTTPQAVGMAASMSLSGRLADRLGAGRVVPFGLLTVLCATAVFTQLGTHTSFWLIGATLVALGAGMGASMMPAMSAAYAELDRDGVARATTELQIIQRMGSTIGAALFAVILQQRITDRLPAIQAAGSVLGAHGTMTELAQAFSSTFWFGVALTSLAILPALLLPRKRSATAPSKQPSARRAALSDCNPLSGNSGLTATIATPAATAHHLAASPLGSLKAYGRA